MQMIFAASLLESNWEAVISLNSYMLWRAAVPAAKAQLVVLMEYSSLGIQMDAEPGQQLRLKNTAAQKESLAH